MRQWADKVGQGLDQVVRASEIDLSTRIIKRTAVGNPTNWKTKYPPKGYIGGAARGNWFASIDSPETSYNAKNIDTTGAKAIANATATASNAVGHKFYLTNNLPYIFRLEYQGWSKQSPDGMVRVSVIEFQLALTKAIREL